MNIRVFAFSIFSSVDGQWYLKISLIWGQCESITYSGRLVHNKKLSYKSL